MSETVVLVLVAPPALEDPLVDWLLHRADVPGFSSFPIRGHGATHERFSALEQVEGREGQVLFWIELPAMRAREFIDGLRRDHARARIHYWLIPALEAGRIDAP